MIYAIRRRGSIAPLLLIALVLSLAGSLTGCATTGAHGERSLILIDTPTEVQMGLETDVGIRGEYPPVTDAALANYVQGVGEAIAPYSDRKDVKYSFTVLQSDIVNAFAAPGGYIYVTTGLLAAMENEAELACVLSHEMGHVTGRHSVRAMQNTLGIQIAAQLLLGDKNAEAWGQVAGAGAGLFMMKNSRSDEFQADQFGVKYAVAAGYDPNGMITFFEKLVAMHGGGADGFQGWFSTHPNTNDRIAATRAEIALYDLTDSPRRIEKNRFLSATAKLR